MNLGLPILHYLQVYKINENHPHWYENEEIACSTLNFGRSELKQANCTDSDH